jgi:hypothetical protein
MQSMIAKKEIGERLLSRDDGGCEGEGDGKGKRRTTLTLKISLHHTLIQVARLIIHPVEFGTLPHLTSKFSNWPKLFFTFIINIFCSNCILALPILHIYITSKKCKLIHIQKNYSNIFQNTFFLDCSLFSITLHTHHI